jgi:hypothetical protein
MSMRLRLSIQDLYDLREWAQRQIPADKQDFEAKVKANKAALYEPFIARNLAVKITKAINKHKAKKWYSLTIADEEAMLIYARTDFRDMNFDIRWQCETYLKEFTVARLVF